MPKRLFAPWGGLIIDCWTETVQSCTAVLDSVGCVTASDTDQFPELSLYKLPSGDVVVQDGNGDYTSEAYCRVVEVGDDFDEWPDGQNLAAIDEWDADIQAKCERAVQLQDAMKSFADFRVCLPKGFEDLILGPALKHLVQARVEEEIASLNTAIDAYRAGRKEIENWNESPQAGQIADDKVQQKHEAQMADMTPEDERV